MRSDGVSLLVFSGGPSPAFAASQMSGLWDNCILRSVAAWFGKEGRATAQEWEPPASNLLLGISCSRDEGKRGGQESDCCRRGRRVWGFLCLGHGDKLWPREAWQ